MAYAVPAKFKVTTSKQWEILLNALSRETLRQLAKDMQIPRGRDKEDTIRNLVPHAHLIEGEFTLKRGPLMSQAPLFNHTQKK